MFKLFSNNFESLANKDLERDKGKEQKNVRHLEKDHYLGEGRLFEDEEAKEDEELVNANDSEKKFIPSEEVPDIIEENEDQNEDEEAPYQGEEPEEKEPAEIWGKNIADYAHKSRGSKYAPLESFHLDHDKEETLAVHPEAELIKEEEPTQEDWEEEISMQPQRETKVKERQYEAERSGITKDRSSHDNIKTWNDKKVERNSRGLLRRTFKN